MAILTRSQKDLAGRIRQPLAPFATTTSSPGAVYIGVCFSLEETKALFRVYTDGADAGTDADSQTQMHLRKVHVLSHPGACLPVLIVQAHEQQRVERVHERQPQAEPGRALARQRQQLILAPRVVPDRCADARTGRRSRCFALHEAAAAPRPLPKCGL
jgi:hypothetical protein